MTKLKKSENRDLVNLKNTLSISYSPRPWTKSYSQRPQNEIPKSWNLPNYDRQIQWSWSWRDEVEANWSLQHV